MQIRNIVQHSSTDYVPNPNFFWGKNKRDFFHGGHGEVLLKHSDVPFAEEILTCAGLLLAKAVVFGFGVLFDCSGSK